MRRNAAQELMISSLGPSPGRGNYDACDKCFKALRFLWDGMTIGASHRMQQR